MRALGNWSEGAAATRACGRLLIAIAVGTGLSCEPRVSVGDNKDTTILDIGFIPKTYNNQIFQRAHTGALDATVDLMVSTGRKVSVENFAPDKTTLEAQQEKVQFCIDKQKRGLIVSCVENGLKDSIDAAVDKGIPVITFDSDCPGSKRLDFYGTNNQAAGADAAEQLATALSESGGKRVAILSGREGASNLNDRVEGFKARLALSYPSLQVVITAYCDETAEGCKSKLEDEILTEFPDVEGLFIVGLWGVLAACECESTSDCSCEDVATRMPKWHAAKVRGLRTVAFDALPFELELMRKTYLSALIGQKYYEWGFCTVTRLFNYLTRGEPVRFSSLGYEVLKPADVERAWTQWSEAEKPSDASAGNSQRPPCE